MLEQNFKSVSCENCPKSKGNLFAALESNQKEYLDSQKKCNFYKKRQNLFVEGSIPRGVFCINEGKVKVFKTGDDGKEQIIQIARAGDLLGFRSMFAEDAYKVSAQTLEESNICFIRKEDFLSLMDYNSVLRNGIIKELSTELTDQAEFITNMAQKSVRQRLAFVLLLLMEVYSAEPINLSREDLANFVGTATETLIRLLKDFKEEGIISTETRKITVLDSQKLLLVSH
jgi:CRP/FNR family transcriptional regulator